MQTTLDHPRAATDDAPRRGPRRPSQAIADDALIAWRDLLAALGAGVACRAAAADRRLALLTREMNGGRV